MHPLKSLLPEAARERKVRGRVSPFPAGARPGAGGEGRERAPATAPQGLKSFSSARLGEADGKGRSEEQGEDLCPGRVIKGKKWND